VVKQAKALYGFAIVYSTRPKVHSDASNPTHDQLEAKRTMNSGHKHKCTTESKIDEATADTANSPHQ
jgi:hypothetical protein